MDKCTAVILAPMDCECELLVSLLEEKRDIPLHGYICYEGILYGTPVVIVRCLIGTVNAAVCTALMIEKYSPEYIILQGTAGAHGPELKRNDIVIAKNTVPLLRFVSPKRKVGDGSDPFSWSDLGIHSYSAKNDKTAYVHSFRTDETLEKLALSVTYNAGRVISGNVGTCDAWNREYDMILHYHNTKETECEAMEGVAVAQVCEMYGVPMTEIRVISNNELVENERFAKDTAINCQKFVAELVKTIEKEHLCE